MVLTKVAGEVAASRPEAEDRRSRQKMVERFLFDRIDTKPDDRPYVVSTMRLFCRARTKQRPRAPSFSLQYRGHISHWTRPSSSMLKNSVSTIGPLPATGGGALSDRVGASWFSWLSASLGIGHRRLSG